MSATHPRRPCRIRRATPDPDNNVQESQSAQESWREKILLETEYNKLKNNTEKVELRDTDLHKPEVRQERDSRDRYNQRRSTLEKNLEWNIETFELADKEGKHYTG